MMVLLSRSHIARHKQIEPDERQSRSPLTWVIVLGSVCTLIVVAIGFAQVYAPHVRHNAVSAHVESFWERSYRDTGDWQPQKIDMSALTLSQPQFDPIGNHIVDGADVYAVERGYVIHRGTLDAAYRRATLDSVLDGVAMYTNASDLPSPFIDTETLQPIPRPDNAEVVVPVGIYGHDLLIARIQRHRNEPTVTVGFTRDGDIVWQYDSSCTGVLKKKPQVIMLENCLPTKEREKQPKKRRFLDVRTGVTKDVTLGANEYTKSADDHVYIIDAETDSLRYFDDTLTLIPTGQLTVDSISNYQTTYHDSDVIFNTFSLRDRIEGLSHIPTPQEDGTPSTSRRRYVITDGGEAHEVTSDFQCPTPVFLRQGKQYLCTLSYQQEQPTLVTMYRVYDTRSHQQVNNENITGKIARFNNGFAIVDLNNVSSNFYLIK